MPRAATAGDRGILPTGTLTLLFTDIEGSTRLLHTLGPAYSSVLERHHAILRAGLHEAGGVEVDQAGDGFFFVFQSAGGAAAGALRVQQALAAEPWPQGADVRVRMGLHTGEPVLSSSGYVGLDVHKAARICGAAHGGQILVSEATCRLLGRELPAGARVRDLGLHRLKDLQQAERLLQLSAEGLRDRFPEVRSVAARSGLPAPTSSLVGRRREIEDVRALLKGGARLLTLTGTAGTGKTRLAIQVAGEMLDDFRDGVYFVPLAAISDPALVLAAVCRTLGVPDESTRTPAESLAAALRDREVLLVLDNFEQIVEIAPAVVELLSTSPRLHALVTSRVALRVRGEREYPVRPLPVPDPRSDLSLASVSQYAAVQLFVQRASAADPRFEIDTANAAAVAEICARLDGLPLAIELAAARVKLFSPRALLDNLGSRLSLLRGGARDLPARHQTLRDAIAWSYNLLSPSEAAFFRTFGAFVGGFTLEAAGAVWEQVGDVAEGVLDGVAALVDKSLLRRDDRSDGDPRFGMLETVREFALEKLIETGEIAAARSAHARHYLSLAERAEPHLTGPDQGEWLARLAAEHDNALAASAWAKETGDAELDLRLANALWRLWVVRGPMAEGRQRMEEIVRRATGPGTAGHRARALVGLATLRHELGDLTGSRELLEEALELYTASSDELGQARTLTNLGWVAFHSFRLDEAADLSRRALARHEAIGDRRGKALALNNLGWTATFQGRLEEARAQLESSRGIRRELGDARGVAYTTTSLGWLDRLEGHYEEAVAKLEAALEVHRHQADGQLTAFALGLLGGVMTDLGRLDEAQAALDEGRTLANDLRQLWLSGFCALHLGHVALARNRADEARDHFRESRSYFDQGEGPWGMAHAALGLGTAWAQLGDLEQARQWQLAGIGVLAERGDPWGTAMGLDALAETLSALGDAEGAAILVGAASSLRADVGVRRSPGCEEGIRTILASVRAVAGEADADAFARRGRGLSLEEAGRFAASRPPGAAPTD